jgi:hypothetical protein
MEGKNRKISLYLSPNSSSASPPCNQASSTEDYASSGRGVERTAHKSSSSRLPPSAYPPAIPAAFSVWFSRERRLLSSPDLYDGEHHVGYSRHRIRGRRRAARGCLPAAGGGAPASCGATPAGRPRRRRPASVSPLPSPESSAVGAVPVL